MLNFPHWQWRSPHTSQQSQSKSLDSHPELHRPRPERNRHTPRAPASLLGRNRCRGNSFSDRFTVSLRLGASNPRPGSVSPFSLRLGFCVNRFALRPLRAFRPPLLEEPGAKQGGSRLEIDRASGLESYAFEAAGGGRVPEL